MYIYAETAFHHEGDESYLIELIDAIAKTACDGVKFQVLTDITDFISTRHGSFETLASYCLSFDVWKRIFEHTANQGLDIILMPLNTAAVKLAGMDAVKFLDIHSVSFNDTILLQEIKATRKNVILGIGGRTKAEIDHLISFFQNKIAVLMVGFQSFPSKLESIGLGKIKKLKTDYPDMEIGYADHSGFDSDHAIRSNEFARLLGATLFEKHVTTTEGNQRVDAASAVSVSKLEEIIDRLKFLEAYVLPVPEYDTFNEAERTYRRRQAVVVAQKDLPRGSEISQSDLALKLYDGSAAFTKTTDLTGRKLKKAIDRDEPFLKSHFE